METVPGDATTSSRGTVLSKSERAAILVVLIKDVLETAAQIHGQIIAHSPGMIDTAQEIASAAGRLLGLSFTHAKAATGAQHDKEISELFEALTHAPARQEKAFIAIGETFKVLKDRSYQLSADDVQGIALAIASSKSQGSFEDILDAALMRFRLEANLAKHEAPERDRSIF